MKQHISKRQWNELSEEHKIIILKIFFKENLNAWMIDDNKEILNIWKKQGFGINIGQMIAFLGNSLSSVAKEGTNVNPIFTINCWKKTDFLPTEWGSKIELCDALWTAVKYKLTN